MFIFFVLLLCGGGERDQLAFKFDVKLKDFTAENFKINHQWLVAGSDDGYLHTADFEAGEFIDIITIELDGLVVVSAVYAATLDALTIALNDLNVVLNEKCCKKKHEHGQKGVVHLKDASEIERKSFYAYSQLLH